MKTWQTEMKWGLVHCGMTIAWALLGKMMGFHAEKIAYNLVFNTLSIVPSFIIYLLALREKRKKAFQGLMSYRQGLASGMLLTVFITALGPLTPLITIGLISPDLFINLTRFTVQSGMMSEAEAAKQFNMGAFALQGLLAAPVFGLLFSLIAAAIGHKKANNKAIIAGKS